MPGFHTITSLMLAFAIGVLWPLACCCAAGLSDQETLSASDIAAHQSAVPKAEDPHACCDASEGTDGQLPAESAAPASDAGCACRGEMEAMPAKTIDSFTVHTPAATNLFLLAPVPAVVAGLMPLTQPCLHRNAAEIASLPEAPSLRTLSVLLTV